MKEIIVIVLILFSMSSVAADIEALKTERTTLREAMSALEEEFNANEIEGERIAGRKSDLEWSATQVEKQLGDLRITNDVLDAKLANHEAVSQAIDAKLANHESNVQTHNSQCAGTFEDKSYVDRCNDRAASLSSERAMLDSEVNSFNAEDTKLNGDIKHYNELAVSVQEMIDNQARQEAIVDLEFEQYKAHWQKLGDAGNRIEARLDEIEPYIDSCEDVIASGSDEYMKAQCGSMFDGNQ